MKQLTHYICETCGGMYLTEKLARDCEASHAKPIGVMAAQYPSALERSPCKYNIPTDILVKFEHSKNAWYTLR